MDISIGFSVGILILSLGLLGGVLLSLLIDLLHFFLVVHVVLFLINLDESLDKVHVLSSGLGSCVGRVSGSISVGSWGVG